jgi:hypothetical protein
MNDRTSKTLKEHEAFFLIVELEGKWKPNELKRKLRIGEVWQSRTHTCNSNGGKGRAGRRLGGWMKHGKKSAANVSNGRMTLKRMKREGHI